MSEELENVFIALINNQVLLQLLFFSSINTLKNIFSIKKFIFLITFIVFLNNI